MLITLQVLFLIFLVVLIFYFTCFEGLETPRRGHWKNSEAPTQTALEAYSTQNVQLSRARFTQVCSLHSQSHSIFTISHLQAYPGYVTVSAQFLKSFPPRFFQYLSFFQGRNLSTISIFVLKIANFRYSRSKKKGHSRITTVPEPPFFRKWCQLNDKPVKRSSHHSLEILLFFSIFLET